MMIRSRSVVGKAGVSDDGLHHRAGAEFGAASRLTLAGQRGNGGGFDTLPRS